MYVLAFNKGNVSKRMSRLFVVFVLPGACLIVTYLVRGVRQDGERPPSSRIDFPPIRGFIGHLGQS